MRKHIIVTANKKAERKPTSKKVVKKVFASKAYRVGDVVEYDGNIRGINPRLGTGTIVQVKPGLAGHGDPNPDPEYVIDNGDRKFTVSQMAILRKIESSCNPKGKKKKVQCSDPCGSDDCTDCFSACSDTDYKEPIEGSDFRPNGQRFLEMRSKQVEDSDGFWTDYTMYFDWDEELFIFIFGDKDVYNPENTEPDFECQDPDEAEEWFNSYNGFADEDDDIYSATAIKSARGVKPKVMSWDEFCQYQYKFQADPQGMPNPTFSDDVLRVANQNNCIRVLFNGNRIGYFCQDPSDYDSFVNAIQNSRILKSYIKIGQLKDADIQGIESKLMDRWNADVAKFGAGGKIPKWRQKDMMKNRARIVIDDYNQGSISVYLPDEMCSFDPIQSSTAIRASEIGMVRTHCDECGALNRVQVEFPDASSPFEDTTYTCNQCGAENMLTDPHVYDETGSVKASEDVMAYDEAGLDDLWEEIQSISQEFTSENTSINSGKLPAIFNMVKFEPGTINVDYGGGRFDNVAEYLAKVDVVNLVFDPFNRSADHNKQVIELIRKAGGADTATCSNVLNVIKEPEVRQNVLNNIRRLTKDGGKVYFTVYEGKGNGQEGPTKSGYQLNRKTADYVEEIQKMFPDAKRKGKLIIATNGSSSVNSASSIEASTVNYDIADLFNIAAETIDEEIGTVSGIVGANRTVPYEHFSILEYDVGSYIVFIDDSNRIQVCSNDSGETCAAPATPEDFRRFCQQINSGGYQLRDEYEGRYSANAATNIDASCQDKEKEGDTKVEGAVSYGFEPPEYDEPEELDPSEEAIEVPFDCNIIMDEDGWEYEDTSYDWAAGPGSRENWYSEDGVFIGDKTSIVECIDDMLMTRLPDTPGTYHISGTAVLVFDVSGINKYSSFQGKDEDDDPIFDEELDLDYAGADFNIQKSDIQNFKYEILE